MNIIVHVTCIPEKPKCDWSKIGLGYSINSDIWCGTVTFELGSKDTCITKYVLGAYSHKTHKFDTLSYNRVSRHILDTGWYTFKASFYNKCGNCDTIIVKEIYVGCDEIRLGINKIIKSEPNLIRMYDMLGRPVYNARENEITIYLYSDGSTRKVIKK
jgi:hypothetical protein